MKIIKKLPARGYTKVHNSIWVMKDLSEGAKCLYGFLSSLPPGKNISDGYIVKCTGMANRTITRRKQELKEAKLICVVQLAPKVYEMYLTNPDYPIEKLVEEKNDATDAE